MRKKADRDKQEAALAEATMASIEAKARKEFEKDMKAAAKDAEERIGKWVRSGSWPLTFVAWGCLLWQHITFWQMPKWVQAVATGRAASSPSSPL